MDMIELIDGLAPATLAPVYLLHGKERFYINRLIEKIRAMALSEPMGELNFARLRAAELTGREVADRARELPMMATKRFILVDEAHKFKPTDWEALDVYFANPVRETVLVFIADSFSLRSGPLAKANRRGQVHKAEPIKDREVPRFIRWCAKQRGVSVSDSAQAALATAVGPDLNELDDAIERLGLFAGEGVQVTPKHIAEVVTDVREHSVFELVDAIGSRNAARAISLLEGLLKRREEPLKINAMIARHVRLLLRARIALFRGYTGSELAESIGLQPWLAQKLANQCRPFRGKTLEQLLARVALTDYELKSSRRPPRIVIEQAVLDLCLP